MKVSIVIPMYNAEGFIKETITSLLNQTYKNIEIIVVDDKSTDNTFSYANSIEDDRLKVIENEVNLGAGFTRNNGIEHITGDYVCFFDADDFIDLDYVEKLVEIISTNNACVGVTSYKLIKGNKSKEINVKNYDLIGKKLYRHSILSTEKNVSPVLWNKIYKADIIKNNNILFKDIRTGQDMVFLKDYYNKCEKVSIRNKNSYYNYRELNENSITGNFDLKYITGYIKTKNDFSVGKIDKYIYLRNYGTYTSCAIKILNSNYSKKVKKQLLKEIDFSIKGDINCLKVFFFICLTGNIRFKYLYIKETFIKLFYKKTFMKNGIEELKRDEVLMNFIPNLADGGAERVVSNLTKVLSKEYSLETVLINNEVSYDYEGELYCINKKRPKGLLSRIFNFRKVKKQLRKAKVGKSVVVSHLFCANLLNLKTRAKGQKTIICVHSNQSDKLIGKTIRQKIRCKIVRRSIRKYYNKADVIVVVSQGIKDDLVKNFCLNENKIEIISNPVDIISIQNIEVKKDDNFSLITAGRLNIQKGQWHLIDIFKELYEEHKNIRLDIYGEGPMRDELQSRIDGYNLSEVVKLKGFDRNVYRRMKESDLFVLPSISEGFGMVLVEAMASGLPVVSTGKLNGPMEIIDNKYGLITSDKFDTVFDSRNISEKDKGVQKEMLSLIKLLLDNKEQYEHYKNMSLTRSNDYSFDSLSIKWIELIRK